MSQQINLFNPVFRKQRQAFSAVTMVQALGIVALALGVLAALEARQAASLERVLADAGRQSAERQQVILRLGRELPARSQGSVLAEETARVEGQLQLRRALLADLRSGAGGGASGYSPILSALARHTVSGVWLTGVAVGGEASELVLKGRVLDGRLVPAYIVSLGKDAAFEGRSVQQLQLALKEAPKAAAPASAGAPGAKPAGPARYIEFSLSMPLGTPARAGAAGGRS